MVQAKQAQIDSHTDAWFVEHILVQPGQVYEEEAARWFARRKYVSDVPGDVLQQEIEAGYAQLAARFEVEFDVFERKQYCNLSHEPNKAMNLNSFLGLMGKRVKPVRRKDGVYLEETSHRIGSRLIPEYSLYHHARCRQPGATPIRQHVSRKNGTARTCAGRRRPNPLQRFPQCAWRPGTNRRRHDRHSIFRSPGIYSVQTRHSGSAPMRCFALICFCADICTPDRRAWA